MFFLLASCQSEDGSRRVAKKKGYRNIFSTQQNRFIALDKANNVVLLEFGNERNDSLTSVEIIIDRKDICGDPVLQGVK